MEGGEGDKKECKFKHHRHGPKFHHFKKGPLKCQKCGEEIEFKWEKPKEGEPRKRPEPPKCQKCGAVWERPKPKCPFCQAELPKPDFKKFKKPEGKPEKKRTHHLQVALHQKMKEKRKKRKKNQRKNQNLKNQNAPIAKKNYHSFGENMVIDMDSEDLDLMEVSMVMVHMALMVLKKKMLKNFDI